MQNSEYSTTLNYNIMSTHINSAAATVERHTAIGPPDPANTPPDIQTSPPNSKCSQEMKPYSTLYTGCLERVIKLQSRTLNFYSLPRTLLTIRYTFTNSTW